MSPSPFGPTAAIVRRCFHHCRDQESRCQACALGGSCRRARSKTWTASGRRPGLPAWVKPGSLATINALEQLQKVPELDWSFLAPSAEMKPGKRTGKFRLGTDHLLVDANGQSRISVEDYAVAMIDELEKPAHIRQRFTVGY